MKTTRERSELREQIDAQIRAGAPTLTDEDYWRHRRPCAVCGQFLDYTYDKFGKGPKKTHVGGSDYVRWCEECGWWGFQQVADCREDRCPNCGAGYRSILDHHCAR